MQLDLSFEEEDNSYIMQLQPLCEHVRIQVVEAVNRGHGLSNYVGYVIKIDQPTKLQIQRRYSQFDALRIILVERWPGLLIPCLPRKHQTGSNSIKVVNERIKYLTYFLNCIAKQKFLYESEEVQLFFNSNNSDMKKTYEKMGKLSYEKKLERFKLVYANVDIDHTKRLQCNLKSKQIIEPFLAELKKGKIPLVNLKKQVRNLALKREEYILSLRVLFNETLPQLQHYIEASCSTFEPILTNKHQQILAQKVGKIKIENGVTVYWLLYEAIRLQITQSQSTIEAIERKLDVQRDEERIRKKIITNDIEINDVKNKKMSLKQIFNRNTDELLRQLETQNQTLRRQLSALQYFVILINQLVIERTILSFQEKRITIWKDIWRRFINNELSFSMLMKQFYEIVFAK